MKTIDGGLSWNRIDNFYFYGGTSYFVDSNNGFLTSNLLSTVLYKTADGGNSWIEIETGFNFEPKVIKFYDNNNGLIAGEGIMIKTSDGGNTWQTVNNALMNGYDFYDIDYRSAEVVFAVGRGWPLDAIFKSNNGGNNWEQIFVNNLIVAYDIFFRDDNTAFLADYNAILKSTDGGNTWAPATTNNPNIVVFRSIHFPSPEIGYAVGDGAFENMLKTTDGGNTWNPIITNVSSLLNSVYFSDNDNGLVFGEGGVLMRTTTGGIVALDDPTFNPDKDFFMFYPNPVSDMVNILFNPDKDHTGARIVVMDGNGWKLKIITPKKSNTAEQYSMKNFSHGIYFLQYVSERGVIETKKIIVH
jgi:photosystem II stability/assembly factor-like uncharacterized protein